MFCKHLILIEFLQFVYFSTQFQKSSQQQAGVLLACRLLGPKRNLLHFTKLPFFSRPDQKEGQRATLRWKFSCCYRIKFVKKLQSYRPMIQITMKKCEIFRKVLFAYQIRLCFITIISGVYFMFGKKLQKFYDLTKIF